MCAIAASTISERIKFVFPELGMNRVSHQGDLLSFQTGNACKCSLNIEGCSIHTRSTHLGWLDDV